MTNRTLLEDTTKTFERLRNTPIETLAESIVSFAPWQGRDPKDFINTYIEVVDSLRPIFILGVLDKISTTNIKVLQQHFLKVANEVQSLLSTPLQTYFEHAFAEIEALRKCLQTWSMSDELSLWQGLVERTIAVDGLLTNVKDSEKSLKEMEAKVKLLLDPATADRKSVV